MERCAFWCLLFFANGVFQGFIFVSRFVPVTLVDIDIVPILLLISVKAQTSKKQNYKWRHPTRILQQRSNIAQPSSLHSGASKLRNYATCSTLINSFSASCWLKIGEWRNLPLRTHWYLKIVACLMTYVQIHVSVGVSGCQSLCSHAEPSCCELILPIIALHPRPTRWKCHQVTHAYLHVAFLSTFTGVCRKMGLSRKYGYQESPWFKISFSQSNSHIAQRNAQFSSIFRHTIIILLLWPHCVPVYPIWTSWFYTPRISLVKIPHFQTDPDHTEFAAASSFRRWRSQQVAYASEPPCIGQAECFWI